MSENATMLSVFALLLCGGLGIALLVMQWRKHTEDCRWRFMQKGLPVAAAQEVCPW